MAIFTLVKCEWHSELLVAATQGTYFVYEAFMNMKSDNPKLLTYVGGLDRGAIQTWAWESIEDINGLGGKAVWDKDFSSYEELMEYCLANALAFVYSGLRSAL